MRVEPLQGGRIEENLRDRFGGLYEPNRACAQVQNDHCGENKDWNAAVTETAHANCTIPAPAQIASPNRLVFQDRLYLTTKLRYYTREKICAGLIADVDRVSHEPGIAVAAVGVPSQ